MAEAKTKGRIVDDVDLVRYRTEGFLYLRNVLPPDLLGRGRDIIEPWIDFQIDSWREQRVIDRDFHELDFWHRLLEAWRAAGRPKFRRRPNKFLINAEMYEFLRQRPLLDIAERVIGTTELSVHGIFNARPQLPGASWTDTPWHQDSQYWLLDYGGPEPDTERRTHVMTMWIPLQPVDASSGSLQVMSRVDTGDRLFDLEDYDYEQTGFFGLMPVDVARYPHICKPMAPGDALIFDQRTPHGADPNQTDRIRWSIDVRYEATATATVVGRKYGFVVQSGKEPATETTLADWLAKHPDQP